MFYKKTLFAQFISGRKLQANDQTFSVSHFTHFFFLPITQSTSFHTANGQFASGFISWNNSKNTKKYSQPQFMKVQKNKSKEGLKVIYQNLVPRRKAEVGVQIGMDGLESVTSILDWISNSPNFGDQQLILLEYIKQLQAYINRRSISSALKLVHEVLLVSYQASTFSTEPTNLNSEYLDRFMNHPLVIKTLDLSIRHDHDFEILKVIGLLIRLDLMPYNNPRVLWLLVRAFCLQKSPDFDQTWKLYFDLKRNFQWINISMYDYLLFACSNKNTKQPELWLKLLRNLIIDIRAKGDIAPSIYTFKAIFKGYHQLTIYTDIQKMIGKKEIDNLFEWQENIFPTEYQATNSSNREDTEKIETSGFKKAGSGVLIYKISILRNLNQLDGVQDIVRPFLDFNNLTSVILNLVLDSYYKHISEISPTQRVPLNSQYQQALTLFNSQIEFNSSNLDRRTFTIMLKLCHLTKDQIEFDRIHKILIQSEPYSSIKLDSHFYQVLFQNYVSTRNGDKILKGYLEDGQKDDKLISYIIMAYIQNQDLDLAHTLYFEKYLPLLNTTAILIPSAALSSESNFNSILALKLLRGHQEIGNHFYFQIVYKHLKDIRQLGPEAIRLNLAICEKYGSLQQLNLIVCDLLTTSPFIDQSTCDKIVDCFNTLNPIDFERNINLRSRTKQPKKRPDIFPMIKSLIKDLNLDEEPTIQLKLRKFYKLIGRSINRTPLFASALSTTSTPSSNPSF